MTGDEDRLTGYQHELRSSGLTPSQTHSFYGRRRGYLVGVTIKESKAGIDPITRLALPRSLILLIHARHLGIPHSLTKSDESQFPDELQSDLSSGRACISIDDGITWLTFFDATRVIQQERVVASLDAFLDWLVRAGASPAEDPCESCKASAGQPVFVDGRVCCLCSSCTERRGVPTFPDDPASVVQLAIYIPIAVIVSALLWGGLWIGADAAREWWQGTTGMRLYLLTIVELPLALLAGVLVSLPFWFVKRQVGTGAAIRWEATICTAVSILLGEVLMHLWLAGPSMPFSQLLAALPRFWAHEGAHAIFRCVVALLAVVVVRDLTKPVIRSSL